jgi:hypothetical protein
MVISRIVFSLVFLLASVAARAETPPTRSYAVLSLAGDALALHVYRHQVGSRTDSSPKEVNVVDDPVFDQMAIIAARSTLLRLRPGAALRLMMTQDKELYRAQNDMFEHPGAQLENREFLKTLLKEQGVTHALVISKFRGNAELKLLNTTEGSGYLEGLGFYIDDMIETRNTSDQTYSRGMLAPFAYVRVRLVDALTLDVIAEGTAKQSSIIVRPSADSSGMETFTKMPGSEKIKHIRTALESAMESVLPGLVAE